MNYTGISLMNSCCSTLPCLNSRFVIWVRMREMMKLPGTIVFFVIFSDFLRKLHENENRNQGRPISQLMTLTLLVWLLNYRLYMCPVWVVEVFGILSVGMCDVYWWGGARGWCKESFGCEWGVRVLKGLWNYYDVTFQLNWYNHFDVRI